MGINKDGIFLEATAVGSVGPDKAWSMIVRKKGNEIRFEERKYNSKTPIFLYSVLSNGKAYLEDPSNLILDAEKYNLNCPESVEDDSLAPVKKSP